MQKLIDGLHAFRDGVFGNYRDLFERLARGQNPEVLFITCSDSRVVPNLITQTDPGDLFVLRNAGNIVPAHNPTASAEAATIEYAVDALGVRDIVVCGHTDCGAMAGLMQPEALAKLPVVAGWLHHAGAARRVVEEHYAHLEGKARITAAAEENVLLQLDHLETHPSVRTALAKGKLRLHGWMYKIATGEVFHYDAANGQFIAHVAEAEASRPATGASA
ncbi:MAG: carbonic anhydrase [Sandaracinaceae bacterium]